MSPADRLAALERAHNAEADPSPDLRQALARERERQGLLPHFGGQGPHRYEEGACVYCGLPSDA